MGFNWAFKGLNGVEQNERVVKCSEAYLGEVEMGRSEVSTSVLE